MIGSLQSSSSDAASFYARWFGRKKLYEFELILFGFALVLGNRAIGWNISLQYGYDTLATNIVLVGSSFLCLCFCMGEMSSALPFSGGVYGFIRAASGPYYGYIVACFEVIYSLTYSVAVMNFCVSVPIAVGFADVSYTPNLIYIFYGINLFLNLLGGKPFWTFVGLSGFFAFVLLLIYLCGTLEDVNKANVDFKVYCERNMPVTLEALMRDHQTTSAQFLGLQYLPLLSEYAIEPRKSIPRAMIVCAFVFLTFSIFITLAGCSSFPGEMILQMVPTPLMFGFQKIFNTNVENTFWITLPVAFASVLSFLYCAGRQLHMIAKSGLLPSFLTYTTPGTGTPAITLLIATIVGVCLNLSIYYNYDEVYLVLIDIAGLSCFFIFLNAFIAYFFFKRKYSSMPRSFINPLGIWGAIYGLASNVFGIISLIMYTENKYINETIYFFVVYFVLASLFYWCYLFRRQKFSEEEKRLMFKAYLINANREKRCRLAKNNRVTQAPSTTTAKKSLTNQTVTCKEGSKQRNSNRIFPTSILQRELSQLTDDDRSASLRPAVGTTDLSTKSLSQKIAQFLSSKMNAVSAEELEEYQQLVVLASGGMIGASEELALEERLGVNDLEAFINDNDNETQGN